MRAYLYTDLDNGLFGQFGYEERPTFFYEAFKDDVGFALDALERDRACYMVLSPEMQSNLQVFDRYFELYQLPLSTLSPDPPYTNSKSVLSDKIRAKKLLAHNPNVLNAYTKLCNVGEMDPDEDVVLAAIDKDTSNVEERLLRWKLSKDPLVGSRPVIYSHIHYLPHMLMRKKRFVLEVCKRWYFPVPWSQIPLYLRMDRDVLTALVKVVKQSWQNKNGFNMDFTKHPGLECVAALFLCKYPLDINADMETLLQIMCLPKGSIRNDPPNSYSSHHIKLEDLARQLFEKVGLEYGDRSKKPRLK